MYTVLSKTARGKNYYLGEGRFPNKSLAKKRAHEVRMLSKLNKNKWYARIFKVKKDNTVAYNLKY